MAMIKVEQTLLSWLIFFVVGIIVSEDMKKVGKPLQLPALTIATFATFFTLVAMLATDLIFRIFHA